MKGEICKMGFLDSFLGLIGASAVFVGADVKERWDEIDRERQRIAANPAPPAEMRGNLRDKYESEWHRGDNTHFPEEYLPALESDPEVLYWWIELLAEREIRRQGYRGYPISIQGNFNRVYNAWKERQNWVR
jgi:hypothetical protein